MQGFDWEALINRTMSAPISINVRSADDASMFDDYDDDDGIVVRFFFWCFSQCFVQVLI